MKELKKLNKKYPNKTAFITGAGSGLGAAFSKLLASNGWTLHLSDINPDSLESLKPSLEIGEIHTYQLDVGEKMAYGNLADDLIKNGVKLDLLINNAGIGDAELFQNYQIDHWERMVKINLLGTYYGSHYLLPLIEAQKGMIVNIGSAAGFMNAPGMSAYNAAKAAVFALAETLHHELKCKGVHVSVVTPTFFKTNIMSEASGSEQFVHFAEKQMKYSTTNADEMAQVVLEQSASGKFHIIHPKEARRAFFFKKWFPGLVARQFDKMMEKFSR
ncbi:SDR family NAD(P)-dependent oxidoreductase [Ekhidna sp. To15]|uniref:SDR family NAD(P)-dependent oxidoreductase n=1 Tax=Ekhidna sp. To15 TaxID=3395267 RepID=UPI003F52336F